MRILFAAPHRMAFLTGSVNVSVLAAWWLWQLASLHVGAPALPQGDLPPVLLHGPAMLFLIFPPFVFGFLLTVFPRWMGYADLGPKQFGPVALLQAAGAISLHGGLWLGIDRMLLVAGFGLIAAGWTLAILSLSAVVLTNWRDRKPICWHALSALGALNCGLLALLLELAFAATGTFDYWRIGNQIGIYGFLVPIFLTVAHRMVPFFAGNVVKDYARWRPDWLLTVIWLLLGSHLTGDLTGSTDIVLVASSGLALTTGLMAWKWWPRSRAPALLKVLIWGFAWAPLGFVMQALDHVGVPLGRAPMHVMTIGFAGSLLIAMVTRVTQGHSGRPLEMSKLACLAFAGIQLTVIGRTIAALATENGFWLVAGATSFFLGLTPWVIRNSAIYSTPRIDNRAG